MVVKQFNQYQKVIQMLRLYFKFFKIYTNNTKSKWNDNESYYRACFSVYCDSYCYGVSIEQFTPSNKVNPISFVLHREGMNDISCEFGADQFYRHIEHIYRRCYYLYTKLL